MSEVPGYQRFLAELKRRRVFRVAAVYGATAFVVVQVADVLQEALHLPEAFLTGVAVLALLGFPIAIVLAWAYERTPQGVVRTGTATTQEIAEIVAQPATRRWPSGVLALVGIVALAAAAWLTLVRQPSGGSDASGTLADASIAVLPFSNLSGDDETQPFVDGIHDDLLTQLSKIGSITVISRTSVQEYRNTTKNVRDIAAELGVSTVLEGGVQRAGDQYRINVQLIDAETDAHLWAEQYSGELTTASIFDVQTQIAASIAAALEANLTAGERANLERLPTRDLEAYELYQGALAQALSGRQEVEFRTAGRLIDRAIERDSTFAEAYAVKAIIASYMYWFFYDRSDSLVAAADEFSRRALELAPGLSDGHWARGHYYYRTQLDYDRALEEVRLALTGRPGDGEFEGLAGDILRRKGDVEGALARYQRAVKLNPRDASQRLTLGPSCGRWNCVPTSETRIGVSPSSLSRLTEIRPRCRDGSMSRKTLESTGPENTGGSNSRCSDGTTRRQWKQRPYGRTASPRPSSDIGPGRSESGSPCGWEETRSGRGPPSTRRESISRNWSSPTRPSLDIGAPSVWPSPVWVATRKRCEKAKKGFASCPPSVRRGAAHGGRSTSHRSTP